jgi:DNA invertase Pin-like site-specific DNA recombinase
VTSVDLYLRVSYDRSGEGASVETQRRACERHASKQGWVIASVFEEDAISATSGKTRPEFERLLKRQEVRPVLVWDMDRLLRSPKDLERVLDTGMLVHSVRAGAIDLSNDNGQLIARMATAVNSYEVKQKSARAKARYERNAAEGKPFFHRPPLGHDRAGSVIESEAEYIRSAYSRLLNEEPRPSLAAIARQWNAADVRRTQLATAWTTSTVKQTLLNPRVYGQLIFRGELMPESQIKPIVSQGEYDALYGILNDPKRSNPSPKGLANLLSGIALCGRCDDGSTVEATMAETVGGWGPVYRCSNGHNQHPREEADPIVIGNVLERLRDDPSVFDGETEEADRQEMQQLRGRLLKWRVTATQAQMDPDEYFDVTRRDRARLAELEARNRDESLSALFAELAPSFVDMPTLFSDAHRLAEWWEGIGLIRRRALVSRLLTVTLLPRQRWSPGPYSDYVHVVQK